MLFVTVGSQRFQFDRLLRAVDECIASDLIWEEVFAQTGACGYTPKNYAYESFLDREEFAKRMDASGVVVTHGGTGAIVSALKKGKRVVAMARLACFGEHVDDHQVQLLEKLERAGLILTCEDGPTLAGAYREALQREPIVYQSNNAEFVKDLDRYLRSCS